jgi:hypothetical protein
VLKLPAAPRYVVYLVSLFRAYLSCGPLRRRQSGLVCDLSPPSYFNHVTFLCSFVVTKLEDVLFCKFFHRPVPGNTSQSFQAHVVSTTCNMQATNLVFRDDVFFINEIDAPFALKGGLVKSLQIELPIVGAALLNRARIKVPRLSTCTRSMLLNRPRSTYRDCI